MKSEKDWQAESDANTLMRAQEIRKDKNRHQAAQGHLKKQASNAQAAMESEMNRKQLEKKTGQRLKNTFGGSKKSSKAKSSKPLQAVSKSTSKGGFHRALGIPEDQKIPVGLRDAIANAKIGTTVRGHKVTSKLKKEAVLARTYAKAKK